MTRKSGPRRLDHWLASTDRSPKATGDHHDTFSAAPSRQHLRYRHSGPAHYCSFPITAPSTVAGRATPVGWARSSPPPKTALAGGGGDADLLANLKAEVGDLSPSLCFEKSRGQLRPALHRTTPRRRRRNRSTGPCLRQPHRSACPIRRRGRRTAPRVRRWRSRTSSRRRLKTSGYPRTAPDLGCMTN